jgi:two-component system, LytTR family, sensor kinase
LFFNAFSNPKLGKWIIPGTGVIWFLGCFLLLWNYQIETDYALIDSFTFAVFFLGGIFVLDRVFSLFAPKGKNLWLLFAVPLVLSWIGVMAHRFVLVWWFDDEQYSDFLSSGFYLRWTILALADQLISVLALAVSQLELQAEVRKREAQMLQLSKDAELAQLRQQLQPHFLFNSLNSIHALVVSHPKKAREMVLQLSEFLRGTIRKDSQQWISLEEELNYLRMYLDIERVRFGHRLVVDFQVGEEFSQIKLPQLLIQPLVENAIKHGLYGVTGEVKIEISGKKEGSYFVLEVLNPFDTESPPSEGTGFGLSSVERRLFLLFGRKDLLEYGAEGHVFKVQLKIPQFL